MLSNTLSEGLQSYRIGPKVRSLRLGKKLGLVELGEHSGLSPAMLSKIERGRLFPTLPTLLRIALVFGVGLEHFFSSSAERPLVSVIRKKDRLRLPNRADAKTPAYFFESLDFPVTDRRMEAFHAEFPAGAPDSPPHRHDGAELIYLLKGQLAVIVEGQTTLLEEGDAMYFDPGVPHSYGGRGRGLAAAIVTVVPSRAHGRS
jgi:quercetin dioxygenase-like cupin family protein/DNA-binding XRE family transcriptional regulator